MPSYATADAQAHLETLSACRLRAVERRLWIQTGFDTSTWVLLAIREQLTRQPGERDTPGRRETAAAVSASGLLPAPDMPDRVFEMLHAG